MNGQAGTGDSLHPVIPYGAGAPDPARSAPHVIGALLIASSAGFIGCVAALLVETSLVQSLAVYSLTGMIVFVFLLIVQTGLQPAG